MNYEELSIKFPKVFEVFKQWAIKTVALDMSENGGVTFDNHNFSVNNDSYDVEIQVRELYDFFDELRVYILLKMFDMGEFYYVIHTNENWQDDADGGPFGEKGNHLVEDVVETKNAFDNRIDAEKEAFYKAFEYIEANLDQLEKYVLPNLKLTV